MFLLVALVVIKPTLRIAFFPTHFRHAGTHETESFSSSRAKYDFGVQNTVVTVQNTLSPHRLADRSNIGYLRRQPALLGIITERHLLNLHFRILPERKIFLQQGRLTV